jgi:Asp/Glu/hydantoin racemase
MSIRIWYQSLTQLRALTGYAGALSRHVERICPEGVEVAFGGVTEQRYRGRMPAEILKYSYAKLVLQTEIIDFCRRAQSDGFDAVIIGSFSEPFLPEIRSLLDIPVVSMPEAALLVACSMGERLGLVTLAPSNARRVEALVRRHGLGSRVSGCYALAHHVDEADLDRAIGDPSAVLEDFRNAARYAVEAGADVVVPAEGILNLIVHQNGVTSIDGATVQDCVGVALLYARLAVDLKRRAGLGVARRGPYAMPPADLVAQLDEERYPRADS